MEEQTKFLNDDTEDTIPQVSNEEENIENVFGIPGEQIMPLYKALSASNINHILTRHEQAAAHAADGYFRSSGKIGVCIATASPGALNFTMALATAYKNNVPILVLTGDNELKYRNTDYFLQGMLLMLHVVPVLLVLFIEVLLT